MILSHAHRFLFLKTSKTAGSSVEIALSRLCGPEDIITPMNAEDEALRKTAGGGEPRNFREFLRAFRFREIPNYIRRRKLPSLFYNHMTAEEVRSRVAPQVWADCYKFCFERNPWDRLVSYYFWRHRKGEKPAFQEFVRNESNLHALKRRGSGVYTIDGEIAVDRVCRFENLRADLDAVCAKLGLPSPGELPRAKSGTREKKDHYSRYYEERDRDLVAEFFKEEISLLGYRFEEGNNS